MKKSISFIVYIMMISSVIFVLMKNDESRKPLQYSGEEMQITAAALTEDGSVEIVGGSGYKGVICQSRIFDLRKGAYTVSLSYSADMEENGIVIWNNGVNTDFHPIQPGSTETEYTFTLQSDSTRIQVQAYYGGNGTFMVNSFRLQPQGRFYTDTQFMIFLFVLTSMIGILFYLRSEKHPAAQETLAVFCILCGIAIFATYPYLNAAFVPGDDCSFHFARIEGIKEGIKAGTFPVILYPDALYGNGYLGIMYPSLFLYIPAVLRIFGVSLALSYKFLILLINIATVLITYFTLKTVSKQRSACLLMTLLYVLMPYRLTNIYARCALGEVLAMMFLPLVLVGFYHIVWGDRKKWPYLAIAFCGLIQSHVLSVLLMGILCTAAGCIWLKRIFTERRYIELGKAAVLTLLLNVWYIVPFLYYYSREDLWTGRLSWSSFAEQSLNPSALFETLNLHGDNKMLSLGIPIMVCMGIALLKLICDRMKTEKDKYLLFLFLSGSFLLFMTTNYFPSGEIGKIGIFAKLFSSIQFPWRLLAPAGLMIIMAGGIWLFEWNLLQPYRRSIFMVFTCTVLLSCVSMDYGMSAYAKNYTDSGYLTGHEVKVSGIMSNEMESVYVPEWRITNTTDELLNSQYSVSSPDKVSVAMYEKQGSSAVVRYTTNSHQEYIEFPLQAYIGYKAYDELGQALAIERGVNNRIKVMLQADRWGTYHSGAVSAAVPMFCGNLYYGNQYFGNYAVFGISS